MALQAQHTNGVAAHPQPATVNPRPYPGIDVESEMTTLDGLVTALRLVRWADELVRHGTAAERRAADAAQEGLFSVIDATVVQAEKLSRVIHGEPAPGVEQRACGCAEDTACDAHAEQELAPLDKQTKCLMRMGGMTDADVAAMSPHERKVLVSYCQSLTQVVINVQAAGEAV